MGAIRMHTDVPGPKSRALMTRARGAAVPRGLAYSVPVFEASAEGATLTDVDGNVFLDFAGGIGVGWHRSRDRPSHARAGQT